MLKFSSVIIAIPLIITKYLFSTKEDKRIASLILHTQDHDTSGKKIIRQPVDNNTPKDPPGSANDEMNDLINKTFKVASSVLATPPIPDATEKKSQNKHKTQKEQ